MDTILPPGFLFGTGFLGGLSNSTLCDEVGEWGEHLAPLLP